MSSNFSCSTSVSCSGHGDCVNQQCVCYPIFTGPSCSINKIDTTPRMPEFFWIHVYGFAILFASIVVLSILQFSIFVYQRGWKNVTKAAITLYGLLCLIGINRTVYLLLDPYRYRGILGPIVESILFGFAISCLAGIYILIILMWIKMYSATHYTKTLDYAVQNAWIAIAVIFIVELIYDIVRGIYAVGLSRLITLVVYTVVLGFGTLIIAILFLIYGHKMYRRLKLFSRNERTKQITMKRINLFAKTTSIITIVLIVMLANFLILQFFFGENIVIFLISHTFQRFFEFCYCLIVIITHWKTYRHFINQKKSLIFVGAPKSSNIQWLTTQEKNQHVSSRDRKSVV